jgi:hypothetical protein
VVESATPNLWRSSIVYLHNPDRSYEVDFCDCYNDVRDAIHAHLELWLEDDSPFHVLIAKANGEIGAVMLPGQERDYAHVLYRNGRSETYFVSYIREEDGTYSSTHWHLVDEASEADEAAIGDTEETEEAIDP